MSKHKFSDQLRLAIARSGVGICELSRRTGIDKAVLSRFLNGKRAGVQMTTLDTLADALGLEVTVKPHTRKGRP